MTGPLGWILPDSPGRHRVCGRECADGSPCQNTVDAPGGPCHLHPEDAPRVDGGPSDPSEVPLSGGGAVRVGATVARVLAVAVAVYFGTGVFVADVVSHLAAILAVIVLGLAVDAYQRRALSEDESLR